MLKVVEKSGPDHDQIFKVCVHLGEQVFGPAQAKNKRDTEQNAAKIELDNFRNSIKQFL